jgi:uncharacterized protein
MDSHQDIVLLFTRYPVPGKSKTRLIPVLGETGAARLQKQLTERVVAEACRLMATHPCRLEIHYAGGDHASMRNWLGDAFIYKKQADGDIGIKMFEALVAHLGSKRGILLVGSDLPQITHQILAEGLGALESSDLVLGPAHDGGYYLIGINAGMHPDTLASLFSGISWGLATVFTETMARVHNHHLTFHILPHLNDIDRPEDLGYLHHRPDAQ